MTIYLFQVMATVDVTLKRDALYGMSQVAA